MNHKIYFLLFINVISFSFIQAQTIELSFSGRSDSLHVSLDSILVENLTQGGDTTLYYPDTTLLLDITTGFKDNPINLNDFHINQNYPNPFTSRTKFEVKIPKQGMVNIHVYDILGKEVIGLSDIYSSGNHIFSFTSGKNGLYLVSVSFENVTNSIKMYCIGRNNNQEYTLKHIGLSSRVHKNKIGKSKGGFSYIFGDQLHFIGYNKSFTDTVICFVTNDTTISFNLHGTSMCPIVFLDNRDNHVYSAVSIGNQCWMTENLAYLPSVNHQGSGSHTTACYYVFGYNGTNVFDAKATINFKTYGVLYNWPAAMNGSSSSDSIPSGVQGICPYGWHLPSNEEWKMLLGEVDSFFGYPDPEWDNIGQQGTDVGGNLKEVGNFHWNSPNTGATNSFGFTALPGGDKHGVSFYYLGELATFWSSKYSYIDHAWTLAMEHNTTYIYIGDGWMSQGHSVRCIKDF